MFFLGVSAHGGLSRREGGVSVQKWVCVQRAGGLYPGVSVQWGPLSKGVSVQKRALFRGISVQEGDPPMNRMTDRYL